MYPLVLFYYCLLQELLAVLAESANTFLLTY